MQTIMSQVEYCNSLGNGDFHIFKNGRWERMTIRSFEGAKFTAEREEGSVVNSFGEYVYRHPADTKPHDGSNAETMDRFHANLARQLNLIHASEGVL